jgi:type VI secretion system protein ImpC
MTTQRTPMPVHTTDEHSILDNIIAQTLLSADDEAYGIAKRGVSAFIEELIKPQNNGEPVKKRLVDRMIAEIDEKLSRNPHGKACSCWSSAPTFEKTSRSNC